MESVWHHEMPNFICLAVDATVPFPFSFPFLNASFVQVSESRYSRCALYCCSSSSSLPSSPRLSRGNSLKRGSEGEGGGEADIYSMEFGSSVDNEVHLEVR